MTGTKDLSSMSGLVGKWISKEIEFPNIITLSKTEQVIIKHVPIFTQGPHIEWTKYVADGDILKPIIVDHYAESPLTETDEKQYKLYSNWILFSLASAWAEQERVHDIGLEIPGIRVFECNKHPIIDFKELDEELQIIFSFIEI